MMSLVTRVVRKLERMATEPFKRREMKRLGMSWYPPNYVYFDVFTPASVVLDVGCGYEAEFSRHMIAQHQLRAYGVDPTRKHAPFLKTLEADSAGKFTHMPVAVSRENGTLTFHESKQNESGSLLAGHVNIQHDEVTDYQVESVSLQELTRRVGAKDVDFLKLDLEGAEYQLFDGVTAADLAPFGQIFLECHHHATSYTIRDTNDLVKRIAALGFEVFTLDEHNYLFYRKRVVPSAFPVP